MDWADDTAYSLNDLVDSANAGFLHVEAIERWAAAQDLDAGDRAVIDALVAAVTEHRLERMMNRKIGAFVEACRLVERDTFMNDLTNRYRFGIELDPVVVREQQLYARLAREVVFQSPQVCQLEHKGGFMIERIFGALQANYMGPDAPGQALLSRDFGVEMRNAGDDADRSARIICDYLAGMTDAFASRIYKRLFDPDYGSIVDLV
jgi:dGTPase